MKRLIPLLLILCGTANAQDTDNFNGRTEHLEAGANWTDSGAAGQALTVVNDRVETDGTESARFAYFWTAQASADFYVEADILSSPPSTTSAEALAIRIVDNQNYIYFVRNNVSSCNAGIRIASSDTPWQSDSPALCDNAIRMRIEAEGTTIRFYLDDGGGMTLYHTQNSVTTFQSSVLGGFASTGASGTDNLALWDNFEIGEISAPEPDFDSGPTLDDCTASGCTFDYDANADAETIHCMATDTAASAPTAAEIEAATGSRGHNSEATTGSADTITIGFSDTPIFPIYDMHCVVEEGTSNYSDVVTVSDNLIDAPTDMQFDAITSAAALSPCALFNAATNPDIANGDYLRSATTTTPGDYALSIAADCQFEYEGGEDDSQQSVLDILVYDASVGAYHADDIDYWNNNNAPVCPTENVVFVFTEDELIDDFDLNALCVDADSDALTFEDTSGTLPNGIELSGDNDELLGGTPDTEDESGEAMTFTVTDPAGETDTFTATIYVIDTITLPDYTAGDRAEAIAAHETAFPWQVEELELFEVLACGAEDENEVTSQNPDPSSEVTAFQQVTIGVSTGEACPAPGEGKRRVKGASLNGVSIN